MTTPTLFRCVAIATVVAGVLEVLTGVAEIPQLSLQGKPFSAAATTDAWWIQQVFNLGKVLWLMTLVGVYSRQAQRTGVFGFIAFVLAFLGTALFLGTIWGFFILAPGLAKTAPAALDAIMNTPQTMIVGLVVPFALTILGWLFFALVTIWAHVLPRWPWILIAVGVVSVVSGIPFSGVIADWLFGVGLVGVGYTMWPDRREQVEITERELQRSAS